MSNLFEGTPDARQADEVDEEMSRFRPRYRALTPEEVAHHDDLKTAYTAVERLLDILPSGRYRALAYTALEESCMWAIKELTDNHEG